MTEKFRAVSPVIDALYAARLEQGLTARALARRIGYAPGTLRKWETGAADPHRRSLIDWAEGLKLDLSRFDLDLKHSNRWGRAATHKEPTRQVDPLVYALRQKRIELGMAVHELATRAGYAEATIRKSENGRGVPNFQIIQNWAQALGCKVELVSNE